MRHPRAGILNDCKLVVCGVAASGKTTLATALAAAFGWPFVEGDDLHPPANRAKMAAGVPLDDGDRSPWLDTIAAQLAAWHGKRRGGVISCSALKRAYRDRLLTAAPDLHFVYLDADAALIATRFAGRRGHFMPAALIGSQFAALETPGLDERVISIAAALPLERQVAAALSALSAR